MGWAVAVAAPELVHHGAPPGKGSGKPAFETLLCRGAHGICRPETGIGQEVIDVPRRIPVAAGRETYVSFEPYQAAGPEGRPDITMPACRKVQGTERPDPDGTGRIF